MHTSHVCRTFQLEQDVQRKVGAQPKSQIKGLRPQVNNKEKEMELVAATLPLQEEESCV